MTITGTSHFVSRDAAIEYYADYEERPVTYKSVGIAVDEKLAAGEIHIGAPTLTPGQTLTLLDNGTRYGIEEKDDPMDDFNYVGSRHHY